MCTDCLLLVLHSLTEVRSVEMDGLCPAEDKAADCVDESEGEGECSTCACIDCCALGLCRDGAEGEEGEFAPADAGLGDVM